MKRTSEKVERAIIQAILKKEYTPGNPLQSERELARKFGVARPIVREAMQRLVQNGWLTVSQRRATVVNDFWVNGNLNILSDIASCGSDFPVELVAQLLEVRADIAPDYAARAVQNDNVQVISCLAKASKCSDNPGEFAANEWELHRTMAVLSGNRIYPLLLNSFSNLYLSMGAYYFKAGDHRDAARLYYRNLLRSAINEDGEDARKITLEEMKHRVRLWQQLLAAADLSGREQEVT